MKFGTGTDFVKSISKNMSITFTFKLCHLKKFDDYMILLNLSMLLAFIVALYLM